MEPRYQRRKEQLLAGCQVPPTLFRGVMSRLESFAQPFVSSLPSPESRAHPRTYLAGLLSRDMVPLTLSELHGPRMTAAEARTTPSEADP